MTNSQLSVTQILETQLLSVTLIQWFAIQLISHDPIC